MYNKSLNLESPIPTTSYSKPSTLDF